MLRRLIPHPILAVFLALLWLLLQESLAPLDVATGLVLGLLLSRTMQALDQTPPNFKRPLTAVGLFIVATYDVVRSNFALVALTLNRRRKDFHSGFVNIPLDIRSPHALAALATIITATPGTFWAAYDARTHVVTIHVLDLVDNEYWVSTIKERYERRLLAVFE